MLATADEAAREYGFAVDEDGHLQHPPRDGRPVMGDVRLRVLAHRVQARIPELSEYLLWSGPPSKFGQFLAGYYYAKKGEA
jgi:hypothetical protein